MFHPDFRPRKELHLIRLSFSEFKEVSNLFGNSIHTLVWEVLENAIATAPDPVATRDIGDQMAELLLCAMSGYGLSALPAEHDPFGVYSELATVHPAILQDIYNFFLGDNS